MLRTFFVIDPSCTTLNSTFRGWFGCCAGWLNGIRASRRRSGRTCKTRARADLLDQRPTGIRWRHGRRHGEDEGMRIRADFIREAVHNNNDRVDKANSQSTWGIRALIKFTLLEVCRRIKCGQSSFCYYWDWLQNDHFKIQKTSIKRVLR